MGGREAGGEFGCVWRVEGKVIKKCASCYQPLIKSPVNIFLYFFVGYIL